MAGTSSKTKPVSLRVPNEMIAKIDGYAALHGMSRAAAILRFVQLGIDASNGESTPATRDDVAVLVARLDAIEANRKADIAAIVSKIESQPIVVQESRTLPDSDERKKKGILGKLLKR